MPKVVYALFTYLKVFAELFSKSEQPYQVMNQLFPGIYGFRPEPE